MAGDSDNSKDISALFSRIRELDVVNQKTAKRKQELSEWNKEEHEGKARLAITRLVLWSFFSLIVFSFLYAAGYNFYASYLNMLLPDVDKIKYLDIPNTVSLMTSALGSSVGFVIGYYFKSKGE